MCTMLNKLKVNDVINKLNELVKGLEGKRFNGVETLHQLVESETTEYLLPLEMTWSNTYICRSLFPHLNVLLKYNYEYVPQEDENENTWIKRGIIKTILFSPVVPVQEDTTFEELEILKERHRLVQANKELKEKHDIQLQAADITEKLITRNTKRIEEINNSFKKVKTPQ